jgi:hypothetical protein
MPEKATVERGRKAKRAGRAPTTGRPICPRGDSSRPGVTTGVRHGDARHPAWRMGDVSRQVHPAAPEQAGDRLEERRTESPSPLASRHLAR